MTHKPSLHIPMARSRRDFLVSAGGGLGAIALDWLLARDSRASSPDSPPSTNPLAARKPHFPAKAKRVIFLFMVGGPSHIDLFDPKDELRKRAGQQLPESVGRPTSQFTKGDSPLLPSTRKFQKHGKSGMVVSDLMPHLAKRVDDICFLKSCVCKSTIHAPAMYEWHSGRTMMGFPSLGSWVTYGLGSVSDNLPAYCVMPQPEGVPEGGAPCWSAGILPAVYQGTLLRRGASPVLNLKPPETVGAIQQQKTYDLVKRLSEMDRQPGESELLARIASYELAFRMQQHAPEAVDLSRETQATKAMYGLDRPQTADFGTRCLLARRLIERGVRFVQVYSGGGPLITQWDAHDDLNSNHEKMCGHVDQPIAALLTDLKSRGLLDDTLVIWGGEFGRTPFSQGGRGRDHNPFGFTMWMAGGGVNGGTSVGTTDEFGLYAEERPITVNDFHATILHLLGLDHERLTHRHNGRDERLTDVAGEVVEEVFA
ncbi:DUF1501 domain-containing protein [Tuwongella immobilis]|uniref:DUF1501 domain-containing protein n=1 Tax=Tuwongella immobilis TaxID=692036 RepID=A0A6C2YPK8_9BACT|nr:DUF1501 domain-containing protein [Tuwongella immobilis]VIP02822.1 protein containing duf1501 : Uncharacterized protein OS=Singulisphaera acidiphila (strain ATCC BAA-1392 / DSM 18658 / VKM B-2454 / MOB10) GN=Sinac_4600 PE=4 SV=1: DUF1501 [Tuwongella immobilis]VTS02554.1 protein containing duf1501 : Uncharacterized protein OS=Singulisphaera acidiphila (strain ATCC BAA-1392 / DSM 18658 / VKM B-2454 / MOB10) GN=Sinac_4600 PE=4 SV=1: DUF1501 [Tuwongella immobilis]